MRQNDEMSESLDFLVNLLDLETIEVATNLTRIRQAGIRTVPAIKIGNDILTGFILTPQMIRRFIEQHL